jgi:predicted glutamine amidotransferase
MCELLGMSCRQPAQLTFSLETLASHSDPPGNQRDGWGAAFYQGSDVALFREPIAAGTSPLVRFLEQRGPRTTLAVSHIRHATRGAVSLSNTQPFMRELAGHMHVFAHNGDLPGIETSTNLAYDRYRPVGTTDSEQAFCALMERLTSIWKTPSASPSLKQRLAVLAGFAADLRKEGPANFLYADGDTLFAHGDRRIQSVTGSVAAPGLYLYSCRCTNEEESVHALGLSVAPGFQEVVLIASVPLTDGHSDWRPFAENEIVAISEGRLLDIGTSSSASPHMQAPLQSS